MPEEEPPEFKKLCELIGMAVMFGQKVQFALAYHYATYHAVNSGWDKSKVNSEIKKYLSKPLGSVISAIEKDGALEQDLFEDVDSFRISRNWLAHDFDEEARVYLVNGEKFEHYIEKVNAIAWHGHDLMQKLHRVGEEMCPVATEN